MYVESSIDEARNMTRQEQIPQRHTQVLVATTSAAFAYDYDLRAKQEASNNVYRIEASTIYDCAGKW